MKKMFMIGILVISVFNLSYAEKYTICDISGIFAREAMIKRQNGASMKEIKNHLDSLMEKAGLVGEFKKFMSVSSTGYIMQVSEKKIGKNKKEKIEMVEKYEKIGKESCEEYLTGK